MSNDVTWDISTLSKEERKKIASRLKFYVITNEEDYQSVIGYLHDKYSELMDKNPDGMNLQWLYKPRKNKISILTDKYGKLEMFGTVAVDPERDNIPVMFSGSYFAYITVDQQRVPGSFGYVLFVDPDYRRMGLASNAWLQEAMVYNEIGIKYQYEIQNEHSLKVTQSIFDDPSKCKIISPGRLKNDGTHSGIRVLLDYTDTSILERISNLPENFKNLEVMKNLFSEEEKKKLIEPWNGDIGQIKETLTKEDIEKYTKGV